MASPRLRGAALDAVDHRGTHLQLIAAAGSGKIEVASQGAAHLLAEGVPPRAIVAFTFTERAADELKNPDQPSLLLRGLVRMAMYRKPRPERHPVLSGTGILLALGAVVAFWRPFLVLAILMAIGGGLFYLAHWAKRRNSAHGTGTVPGRQPTLTMRHGSIVIGPDLGPGRPAEDASLDRDDRYIRQASDYQRPPGKCDLVAGVAVSVVGTLGASSP
jgi:hypothetical protein